MTSCFTQQELGSTDDLSEKFHHVEDEDSTLDEKHEHDSSKYNPPERGCKLFKWLKKQRADRRNRKDEKEVERIRALVKLNREKIGNFVTSWTNFNAEAHLRQEAWAKGREVPERRSLKYFNFSTKHSYKVEVRPSTPSIATGLVDDMLDLRTTEGKAAAVAWVESRLQNAVRLKARSIPEYDKFDVAYEKWLQGGKAAAMSPSKLKISGHFYSWGYHLFFSRPN